VLIRDVWQDARFPFGYEGVFNLGDDVASMRRAKKRREMPHVVPDRASNSASASFLMFSTVSVEHRALQILSLDRPADWFCPDLEVDPF